MLRHLEKNKVLTTLNHDFRSGYSCETQLLITINDLLKSCDKGKQIDMAILDFSKAFDTRADPGFQVRGVHLKKLRRAEGGAKIFGVFRVKNHDFTPKNHIHPWSPLITIFINLNNYVKSYIVYFYTFGWKKSLLNLPMAKIKMSSLYL